MTQLRGIVLQASTFFHSSHSSGTKARGNVGTTYLDSDPTQFPAPIKAPAHAPNVLLVLLDDVGFGQFSVSGGGVPSPHMEALAKEGVFLPVFTRRLFARRLAQHC